MIQDSDLPELRQYRKLEKLITIRQNSSIEHLVAGSSNQQRPVHGWFRFKESYDSELLSTLLAQYPPRTKCKSILDPYCGVGTTLVSAQTLGSRVSFAIGIEHNPFIRFVAAGKLEWHAIDPKRMIDLGEKFLSAPLSSISELPLLSSVTTGRCISTHIARRIVGLRNAIVRNGNSPEHRALLLGLASAIETVSKTRKDGRALRLVDRPSKVVAAVVRKKWQRMAKDIATLKAQNHTINRTQVVAGDGRRPRAFGIADDSIGIISTSPPYPNNIDYSEVYKLELWLLGLVKTQEAFRALRKGSMRSHPSSQLEGIDQAAEDALLEGPLREAFEPILSRLMTAEEPWRRKLLIGYFYDMKLALFEYFKVLRSGGKAYITVGNSLHGGKYSPYVVATDLLIAQLAASAGFRVDEIAVARSLKRRLAGNHFLRESVVVISK